jgi:hypothetical protein
MVEKVSARRWEKRAPESCVGGASVRVRIRTSVLRVIRLARMQTLDVFAKLRERSVGTLSTRHFGCLRHDGTRALDNPGVAGTKQALYNTQQSTPSRLR